LLGGYGWASKPPKRKWINMNKMTNSNAGTGSFAARAQARRGLLVPLVSLALLAPGSMALAQEAPPVDEDLQFLLDNGFESFIFAQTCRSVGAAGDVIEGEPLPVGGGRQLECETDPVGFLQAIDTLSSTGERFCALGQVSTITGSSPDSRLSVNVVSTPDGAPWTLVGTHDGEEISIARVSAFGGLAWPLIADVVFDVTDVQPNPAGQLCDDVFGI
jgi:hypothetical protein